MPIKPIDDNQPLWDLLQIDVDTGSREDYSILYNPVVSVLVDDTVAALGSPTQRYGHFAALLRSIPDRNPADPNRIFSIEQIRDIFVQLLRDKDMTVRIQNTAVLDKEDH